MIFYICVEVTRKDLIMKMEMMERENFMEISTHFLASCQSEEKIGDVTNDEATNDVTSTIAKDENGTRKCFHVTSGTIIETASQDSKENETTRGFAHLAEGPIIAGTGNGATTEVAAPWTGHFLCEPLQFLRRRYGLVLASLSPFFFSIENLFVAVLNETLDAFQVVFMHVPILMICSLILVTYKGIRPPRDYKQYLWLLGTGLFQATSVCFIALSLKSLAVGDAVTITCTCVIQVSFLSWLILKEPLRLFDLLFALLAFGGVIFIARPPFIFRSVVEISTYFVTFHGILFALAGSFAIAMYRVFSRKLFNLGVNGLFCIFFNVTATVILSGLFTFIFGRWRCPSMFEWLFSLLSGISYAFALVTIFYALKVETATFVTILGTLQILFAFVWQVLFLHLPPFWTSFIGAILTFVACIGITMKNKPPPSALET